MALTEDQLLIVESVRQFAQDWRDGGGLDDLTSDDPVPVPPYDALAQDLGMAGLGVAEEYGGAGLGLEELALVVEVLGAACFAGPFLSTAGLATRLLQAVGDDTYLPRIAAGAARFAIDPTGTGRTVLDGDVATDFLIVQDGALYHVSADDVAPTFVPVVDATRGAVDIAIDRATKLGVLPPRALNECRVLLAAELIGVAQAALDMTVAYTKDRVQFGRTIASFQAIKHRAADMMVLVEEARSALAYALQVAADNPDSDLGEGAAIALSTAADNAFKVTGDAIQLHGGIGFTWDYPLHFYFKRARAAKGWLGTPAALRAAIAATDFADEQAEFAPELAPFRAEVRGWMADNLSGAFAALKHRGGPGDEDAFPDERKVWEQQLGNGGWTSLSWPTAHGGRDASIEEQVVFFEEYAAAGGPGRSGHIGTTLVAPTLIALGTPDQQDRFLPGIKAGTDYWCQGYSEPNAGSDLSNVRTKARLDGDEWVIDGQKIWTSNAHESDWCFVVARAVEGTQGRDGLVYLLVPLDQPGVTIKPIIQMTGTSEFNEVFFDGARTADRNRVGDVGAGWKIAMATLGFERGVSTLGQQMLFRNEFDLVVRAAKDNGTYDDPLIRDRLAKMWAGLKIMRTNTIRTMSDPANAALERAALMAKLYWASWHRDLGALAMDAMGGNADRITGGELSRLQRLFMFSRADTLYGGTNQIQRNIIAERALQMPKEPRGDL